MYLFLRLQTCLPDTISISLHSTMYLFLLNLKRDGCCMNGLYIPQCIYFYILLHILFFLPLSPLHSTMYLFLQGAEKRTRKTGLLYIPQCIYFYRLRNLKMLIHVFPLHSTMYLFLRKWKNPPAAPKGLYIPQCIYFYSLICYNILKRNYFTFHNVSISTDLLNISVKGPSSFTFHNVSISTRYEKHFEIRSGTLHSTMYLFLPETTATGATFKMLFTFHNVSISTQEVMQE